MSYQDWLDQNGFTMHYEVIAIMPDGSVLQTQKSRKVASNKQADDLINEWNRLAKITQNVKYSYRRLS